MPLCLLRAALKFYDKYVSFSWVSGGDFRGSGPRGPTTALVRLQRQRWARKPALRWVGAEWKYPQSWLEAQPLSRTICVLAALLCSPVLLRGIKARTSSRLSQQSSADETAGLHLVLIKDKQADTVHVHYSGEVQGGCKGAGGGDQTKRNVPH